VYASRRKRIIRYKSILLNTARMCIASLPDTAFPYTFRSVFSTRISAFRADSPTAASYFAAVIVSAICGSVGGVVVCEPVDDCASTVTV
jgi:hypothetical protein